MPSLLARLPTRIATRPALVRGALALAAAVTLAPAQTSVYTGTGSGNWLDAANWSAGIPDSADETQIATGAAVTLAAGGSSASLYVSGSTLAISGGGSLALSGSGVGLDYGAALAVTGPGSQLAGGDLTLYTATARFGNQASVTSGSASLASLYPDNVAAVTVEGGAQWLVDGMSVGSGTGGSATLLIQDGADVSVGNYIYIESNGASPANSVTVTGSGTTLHAGSLNVGSVNHGLLTIANGASVTSDSAGLGADGTYNFATGGIYPGYGVATVSGGSHWNTGSLEVGRFGTGTLTISGGSVVTSSSVDLAYGSGGGGAGGIQGTVTVTGASSQWNVTGTLRMGNYSSSSDYNVATLTVADSASVTVGAETLKVDRNSVVNIGSGALAGTLNAAGVEFNGSSGLGTLAFNHTDNIIFSLPVTGLGQVTKDGSGSLTLSGDNSYKGPTWIKEGTISVASVANQGTSAPNSALGAPTTANGRIKLGDATDTGTLRYTGSGHSTNRGFELSGTTGGGGLDASGSGALTVSGTVTATGAGSKTLTLTGTNTGANTLSGVISNQSGTNLTAVNKSGAGTWVLSAANTFTGGATVSAGTLRATASTGALGAGTLTLAGGTLEIANNTALNLGRNTTVTGNATIAPGRTSSGNAVAHGLGTLSIGSSTLTVAHGSGFNSNQTGSLTFGATTVTGNATFNLTNANGSGTGVTTLGALNDGGAARTITKSGAGTLTLGSAATSLVNGTAVNLTGGTLNSNHATALGSLANVTLSSGATFVAGASQALGALNGAAGTVSFGTNTLTIGQATNNLASSFSGTLSGSTGALVKAGSGTLTLASGNSYSGGTTLSGGTTRITNASGSAFGSGAVTVASGATLTGGGAFSGALTNHGTYAPGNSPALATLSAFSQGNTGTLELEIAGLTRGTGYDALNVTGALAFDGALEVSFIDGFTAIGGESFNFFDWGSVSGTFDTLLLPDLTAGLTWNTSALYSTGTLSIAGTAIPEPSTCGLIAGLAMLAVLALRRRHLAPG